MERERDDRGQFVETIALDDVVRAVRESPSPVVTATEVGEELGCTAEAARQKLLALRDQGVVTRRTVGAGAVVWWIDVEETAPTESYEIGPEEPLFSGGALFASGEALEEADVDDVVYGGEPGERGECNAAVRRVSMPFRLFSPLRRCR